MPSKLDELRKKAESIARDLDEKYEVTSKIDAGVRAADKAVRKGADVASSAFDTARTEVSRIDEEHKISQKVGEGARRATAAAKDAYQRSGAAEPVGDAVNAASDAASGILGKARKYYDNAAGAARAGSSAASLPWSVAEFVNNSRQWIKNNPGKAAVVSIALTAGVRAGAALSSLDVVVLGAGGAGNWLFHSALVPFGLRKLSEKYEGYLDRQQELVEKGDMDEAEKSRIKFQADVARYVGAPLLGAFSVTAGIGLMSEAFTGGVVTGVPISLLLGGNPLLSSVWLFGNGLVCFHNGYKFFMMALGEREDVAKVVRDVKGLIPASSAG